MSPQENLKGLYTYSMVKAMFDRGTDYIDSFWPFVVRALPHDKTFLTTEDVRHRIEVTHGLSVPTHSLRTIIDRAKHKGFVSKDRPDTVRLTDKGLQYVDHLETTRDVDRRIVELVRDATTFLGSHHNLNLTETKVRATIESVIAENLELFAFINDRPVVTAKTYSGKAEIGVVDYFRSVEQGQPAIFRTLRDMICGSIISSVIYGPTLDDATRKFANTEIYLDSNLVLSILGLDHDYNVQPAKELLALLRHQRRFELKVFDFTVAETISLLRTYKNEHGKYSPDIPVTSIHSALKLRGFAPGDIAQLIGNIDSQLSAIGIHIVTTGIQLRDYDAAPEQRARLEMYKPGQPEPGQRHDLAAVDMIKRFRHGTPRRIEEARFFFLTSDLKLAKYAHCELGHQEAGTVSEVLPDRLLTNLLWLKNPSSLSTVSIGAVIALHSRDLFIDRDVWERFTHTVETMVAAGTVQEADASLLLYDGRVQESLRTGASEAAALDTGWLVNRVTQLRSDADDRDAEAKRQQAVAFEARKAEALSDQQLTFSRTLELEREKQARERKKADDAVRKTAQASVNEIWAASARDAVWAVRLARALVSVALAAGFLMAWPQIDAISLFLNRYEPLITWSGAIAMVIGGWRVQPHNWPRRAETKLANALFDRRTKDIKALIASAGATAPGREPLDLDGS